LRAREIEACNAADGAEEDAGRARNREEGRLIGTTQRGCPKGGFRIVGIPLSPTLQIGRGRFHIGVHKIKPSNFRVS